MTGKRKKLKVCPITWGTCEVNESKVHACTMLIRNFSHKGQHTCRCNKTKDVWEISPSMEFLV